MPKAPRNKTSASEGVVVGMALQCKTLIEAFTHALIQYDRQVPRFQNYPSYEPEDFVRNIQYNLNHAVLYRNNDELFYLYLLGVVISQQELEFTPAALRETYKIHKPDYKVAKMLHGIFKGRQEAIHYTENITVGMLKNLSDKACHCIVTQVSQRRPNEYIVGSSTPPISPEETVNGIVQPRPREIEINTDLEFELRPEFTRAVTPVTGIREILQKENTEKRKRARRLEDEFLKDSGVPIETRTAAQRLLETCDPIWDLWTEPDLDPKLIDIIGDDQIEGIDAIEVYGDVNVEYQWD
jgi:hypothetical protein